MQTAAIYWVALEITAGEASLYMLCIDAPSSPKSVFNPVWVECIDAEFMEIGGQSVMSN